VGSGLPKSVRCWTLLTLNHQGELLLDSPNSRRVDVIWKQSVLTELCRFTMRQFDCTSCWMAVGGAAGEGMHKPCQRLCQVPDTLHQDHKGVILI